MNSINVLRLVKEAACEATIEDAYIKDLTSSAGLNLNVKWEKRSMIDAITFVNILTRAIEAEEKAFKARNSGNPADWNPEIKPDACPIDGSCEACQ